MWWWCVAIAVSNPQLPFSKSVSHPGSVGYTVFGCPGLDECFAFVAPQFSTLSKGGKFSTQSKAPLLPALPPVEYWIPALGVHSEFSEAALSTIRQLVDEYDKQQRSQ